MGRVLGNCQLFEWNHCQYRLDQFTEIFWYLGLRVLVSGWPDLFWLLLNFWPYYEHQATYCHIGCQIITLVPNYHKDDYSLKIIIALLLTSKKKQESKLFINDVILALQNDNPIWYLAVCFCFVHSKSSVCKTIQSNAHTSSTKPQHFAKLGNFFFFLIKIKLIYIFVTRPTCRWIWIR